MGKRLRALLGLMLVSVGFCGVVLGFAGAPLPPHTARDVPAGVSAEPTQDADFAQAVFRPTVILDAGHGGEDGGAVSAAGAAEKTLNLSITLALGDMLRANGVEVIYTRTDDNGLYDGAEPGHRKMADLKNRLAVHQAHPDALFLSIHMNTFSDPRYDGMQFFYSKHHPSSAALAEMLRQANCTHLQPDNTRACKAADSTIYLLDRAEGTSVLAECGFLSNPEEASALMTPEYREQVAAVLCIGILDYLYHIKESPVQ